MVTHDNSLAPRFTRHIVIQDGEIIPEKRRRV
jgi:ABC-type lipoprotein export system ATPase subunit